jgi:hypothetical protein
LESIGRGGNLAGSDSDDSAYWRVQAERVQRIMEPAMVDPFKAFPEPHAVKLRRICVAQVVVSVSALTSTAVLLSCLTIVVNKL